MGRKAKLKRDRKQAKSPEKTPTPESLENTDFVKEIQNQGYTLNQNQTAPEIPQETIKPQI